MLSRKGYYYDEDDYDPEHIHASDHHAVFARRNDLEKKTNKKKINLLASILHIEKNNKNDLLVHSEFFKKTHEL